MGEGRRSARSSAPLVYCVAWPGSVELLVGAKIFFSAVGAAECNILAVGCCDIDFEFNGICVEVLMKSANLLEQTKVLFISRCGVGVLWYD